MFQLQHRRYCQTFVVVGVTNNASIIVVIVFNIGGDVHILVVASAGSVIGPTTTTIVRWPIDGVSVTVVIGGT